MAADQDKRRQIAEADQDKRRLELVAEAVTFTIEAYSRMRGRSQPDTTLAELKTLLGEMSDVPVIVALQKYAEVRVDSLEGQSAETIEQMKARILERSRLAKAATQNPRNFECPESGTQCNDPRCSKEHCCETARLQVRQNTLPERDFIRRASEIARRVVSKFRPKNSK